jgi:YVTN family beta-propeller protein
MRSVPVTHEVIGGALALDATSHLAYVVNGSDPHPEGMDPADVNSVAVVDTQGFAVRARIPVADNPTNITVDPSTHRVYVASDLLHQSNGHDWINGTVSVIDPVTLTVTSTITVGKFPTAMAIDPAAHTLYVANSWDSSIMLIDTTSGATTATIPNVDSPGTLALDPIGHLLYATKYAGDTVSIIDTATRKMLRVRNIGEQADAAIFDPPTRKVYVANFADHTLSVIVPSSQ